jgi:hypothetical protein
LTININSEVTSGGRNQAWPGTIRIFDKTGETERRVATGNRGGAATGPPKVPGTLFGRDWRAGADRGTVPAGACPARCQTRSPDGGRLRPPAPEELTFESMPGAAACRARRADIYGSAPAVPSGTTGALEAHPSDHRPARASPRRALRLAGWAPQRQGAAGLVFLRARVHVAPNPRGAAARQRATPATNRRDRTTSARDGGSLGSVRGRGRRSEHARFAACVGGQGPRDSSRRPGRPRRHVHRASARPP